MKKTIRSILDPVPVVPVLAVNEVATAVEIARALVGGGLPVIEITLRTPAALAAAEAIVQAIPSAIVGLGTCVKAHQIQSAVDVGASFVVTPGITDRLIAAAAAAQLPLLAGVATASEIIRAQEAGLSTLKFFPAHASGGVHAVKAFAGPFADVTFCPTGGITPDNAFNYLALPNVVCVGGSWFAPPELVSKADWKGIGKLAEATLMFSKSS